MRKLVLLPVAAAMLVLAGPAVAKEPKEATLCGPDTCASIDDSSLLLGLFQNPGSFGPPAAGPYYRLSLTLDVPLREYAQGIPFWYVPGGHALRGAGLQQPFGEFGWLRLGPTAAKAFDDALRGVEPFPGPTITGVRIGGRPVSDPQSYVRLFSVTSGPGLRVPDASPWQDVTFTGPPSPWTGPDASLLQYSAGRNLLYRGTEIVRLPDELAARVEARASLAGDDGFPWVLVSVVSLAAALAAAGGVVVLRVVRRRPPVLSAPEPR